MKKEITVIRVAQCTKNFVTTKRIWCAESTKRVYPAATGQHCRFHARRPDAQEEQNIWQLLNPSWQLFTGSSSHNFADAKKQTVSSNVPKKSRGEQRCVSSLVKQADQVYCTTLSKSETAKKTLWTLLMFIQLANRWSTDSELLTNHAAVKNRTSSWWKVTVAETESSARLSRQATVRASKFLPSTIRPVIRLGLRSFHAGWAGHFFLIFLFSYGHCQRWFQR